MSRYKYDKDENKINSVLNYQSVRLNEMNRNNLSSDFESDILHSERILKDLGYDMPASKKLENGIGQKVVMLPSWNEICTDAENRVGNACTLESLFSEREMKICEVEFRQINKEFNELHRLDTIDISICALASIIGAAVDILLVGIPTKTSDGIKAGTLADFIRKEFEKRFPPEEMEKLAKSKSSKVPYDAQDNRNTTEYVEGLSAYYHRLLSLGHDPFLGFIVGVFDIMTGRMTTIDKSGKIVSQVMDNYSDRKESNIFKAIAKEFAHLKSDVTTSMGLPAPLMSVFNLFQFGKIGDEEQTIAEIVQGMYYEGYDFIHFCSLSIPVMIEEVIIRMGYALKRINEGYGIGDSIPASLDRCKHPKLATMLFTGHTGAAAINAGKVYFTKNPMAINYPQWLAFAKHSYKQLKWLLIEKPQMRYCYVEDILDSELQQVIIEVDKCFDDCFKNYTVVIDDG